MIDYKTDKYKKIFFSILAFFVNKSKDDALHEISDKVCDIFLNIHDATLLHKEIYDEFELRIYKNEVKSLFLSFFGQLEKRNLKAIEIKFCYFLPELVKLEKKLEYNKIHKKYFIRPNLTKIEVDEETDKIVGLKNVIMLLRYFYEVQNSEFASFRQKNLDFYDSCSKIEKVLLEFYKIPANQEHWKLFTYKLKDNYKSVFSKCFEAMNVLGTMKREAIKLEKQ